MSNTASSRTDSCVAGVVTHKIRNKKEGTFCYLKYAKGGGSSVSIAFTFIDPGLHATDEYQEIYLSAPTTPAVQTYSLSASGNYRLPVPVAQGEAVIKATVTFTGGSDQTLVVDFRDQ